MSSSDHRTPLARAFFDRPVLEVAPDLLGRTLVRTSPDGPIELRITEVEAYAGEVDPGSHAYRGRTERNASMFGPPGHAYVYFIYGMWFSLNLVCGPEGTASGVLLRAGEVLTGHDLARARRPKSRNDRDLAQGPARLATALDVDRTLNGTDICAGPTAPLSVLQGTPALTDRIRNGPRTGVGGEGALHPWRFWIDGDPTVSPYRAHVPRNRGKNRATSDV
ncbi:MULTISPECIES: DNA-3-methyladenine glycosylase [Streptomyces]|uniref:DNA-3-methyladenine glycosylase n=1 Tax=Streptomyces TaxID=1883 RepID=UPI00163D1A9F|nr:MULTISPECIES: DNA-3-methyladenine glycosylase [Streptomyces]MBC2879349.1 DNA-3-methyladenine glycosylase [Streptomyces sp. TYQ1024]UBI39602.1 DNA-3-methyladenine glycosylase [Streptomyces mobaraensis]UKW32181.1 DNA-3-methyladenine glycosylase [Streptomyces sp. TYQ1024]